MGILDACELYAFSPEVARVFENAIERMFYLDGPRLLRFAIGGDKLRLFSVACLSGAGDPQLIQREKLERIVWISGSGTPSEGLALPPKHFFAARQADGSHCFYGSNGP